MIRIRFPRFSFRAGTLGFGLGTAAIFGIALFFAIADLGFARIWTELVSVGLGLPAIMLVHVGQLAFCTFAWGSLFNTSAVGGRPGIVQLLALRWIRESIDSLLPVAQVGGEIAVSRLLATGGIVLPIAGASIIADVTIETLTQAAFTLIGFALIFLLAVPGDVAHWAALGFAIALLFAALAVFAQRWGGVRLFEKLLLAIAARLGWDRLEGVAGLDVALTQVYQMRGKLFLAGLHHMVAWSLGAGEVMIAAWALGYHLNLGQSYVIESLAQAIRSAAFFVPGAVGIQEGGFMVLAGLFGVPPDAALSISLTKRVRELALGLPGLAAWQWQELQLRQRRRMVEMDTRVL
ncbi:MAG: putative rane protein [Rhodospirillales bacterium]|nr:putative rane protein [Rhodospirillales bacterium]